MTDTAELCQPVIDDMYHRDAITSAVSAMGHLDHSTRRSNWLVLKGGYSVHQIPVMNHCAYELASDAMDAAADLSECRRENRLLFDDGRRLQVENLRLLDEISRLRNENQRLSEENRRLKDG